MAASAHSAIQGAIGDVFDALRDDVFFDSSDVLKLVKATAGARTFTDVLTVSSKWLVTFDKSRQVMVLRISDTSSALTTAMATATHVSLNGTIYVIRQGDTTAPIGMSPFWTVLCDRFTSESQNFAVFR